MLKNNIVRDFLTHHSIRFLNARRKMKIFFLTGFVLLFAQINCSVRCSENSKSVQERQLMRKALNNGNSFFAITDYAVLDESVNISGVPEVVRLIHLSKGYHVPILFIKYRNEQNTFMVKMFSNMVTFTSTEQRIKVDSSPSNLKEFLNSEKCIEIVSNIAWHVQSKNSFLIVMIACHMSPSKNPGQYLTEKKLIFLTDENFNRSIIENFDAKKSLKRKFLEFSEFDSKGFCICDGLANYVNDCPREENIKGDFKIVILFVIFIAAVLILFKIYQKVFM